MKKSPFSVPPMSQVTATASSSDLTDELDHEEGITTQEQVQALKQKSVSGAVSYMLRTLVLYGISIVSAGLLGAYLTVVEFGIYGLVTQIIGILTFFSDIGFASALIQKKTHPTTTEYRTVFTVQQLLSWFIFSVTVIIALSHVFDAKLGQDGVLVLLALGFSFPLASLKTIPSVMLERRLDFSKLVVPQVFEQLAYNGILVVCAIAGLGVRSFVFAVLARSIIGVIVMYVIQRWPIGFSLNQHALQTLIGTGVKFQLNDFIARIKDQLFYLFLGLFLPLQEFGYITFAKQWSMMPYQLTVQNVIAITFPTYARLQHDKNLLRKAIEKTIFFISLLIFPLLVGMCVFIIPFTQLVTKYQKWQPAVLTFIFFTLSIGWSAVSTPLTNTLNAIGRINTTLKLMVMWTVLTWVLTPILVKLFGFNGVALAALVIAFTSFIPIYLVRKVVPIQVWDNVWRQLLAAVAMAGIGVAFLPIWSHSLPVMVGGMGITGIVYVGTLLLIGYPKLQLEFKSLRRR